MTAAPAPLLTLATLVTGPDAGRREAAIARALDALPTAVILEGIPDGRDPWPDLARRYPALSVARIAPGCVCCSGNLTLRVTLNRMLRRQPQRLFISLASVAHLAHIRQFLLQEPYDKLLSLTKELATNCRSID